jgi:hypothetical protein
VPICTEYGIEMVFNVGAGGKVESSSWLLQHYADHVLNKEK